MEKSENRRKYLAEFKPIIDSVNLTDKFISELKSHPYFRQYEKTINDLNDDKSSQKTFIFSELTRDRYPCKVFIELLKHHYKETAERLNVFNTSLGVIDLSNEVSIPVAVGMAPKEGLSKAYMLTQRPRGKLVIINNVEKPQFPSYVDKKTGLVIEPQGLQKETQRFKHVFEQLYFDVEVLTELSAKQMKDELTRISRDDKLGNYEAFVHIVISHGQDEKVLGYNACEANRRIIFGEVMADNCEAQELMRTDQAKIKELVDIFSEQNCPALSTKPKLHFFICCRVSSVNQTNQSSCESLVQQNKIDPTHIKDKPDPKGHNLDTFVSYACAKGFETFFDLTSGMSYYGQALSHAIAQFACDESLAEIMSRTCQRLKHMYSKREDISHQMGSYAIQVNTYAMSRSLYFNPGFPST